MNNLIIETDISVILKELQSGQKEILKEISDVKVSLETSTTRPIAHLSDRNHDFRCQSKLRNFNSATRNHYKQKL
jgi:hypothetical protein